MDAGLIINAIVIALLATTIFYAFRLERRLTNLRSAQAALGDVIRDLNAAAARAEAGIQGLKHTAESSGHALDERIKRARSVSDELGLLLQAGQRSAQRLDALRPAAPNMPQRATAQAPRAFAGIR